MAVTQNPIIGKSKQKFGNAVFSKWKGINTLRTKPLSVANPRSEGQRNQRNRLSVMNYIGVWFRGSYLAGFAKSAIGKSEWNIFVAKNIENATQTDPNAVLPPIYDQIQLAQGSVGLPATITAVATLADTTITYSTADIFPSDEATDLVNVAVAINLPPAVPVERENFVGTINTLNGGATRADGTVTITNPANRVSGDTLTVYLFMTNPITKEASNQFSVNIVIP